MAIEHTLGNRGPTPSVYRCTGFAGEGDERVILNTVAIALSVLALLSSTYFAFQQVSSMKRANYLPAYLALLNEFRSPTFHQHHRYIIQRLGVEHDPDLGISGLPAEAQEAVYDVAFFLHNFVILKRLGIIDDRYLITLNNRVVRTWQAIGPFVQRERELVPLPHLLQILEDYAATTAVLPPDSGQSLLRP